MANKSIVTKHIVCYCNKCKKNTNHTIVASYAEDVVDEELEMYMGEQYLPKYCSYNVVKCDGCDYVSFEKEVTDYNLPEEYGLQRQSLTYPLKAEVYEDETFVSKLNNEQTKDIYKMYNEVVAAINSKCYQLATIGFRAVVEAICKNQVSDDKRLCGLIDELEKLGLVSRLEKERLHKIRLEGNVSVHQFKDIPLGDVLYIKEVVDHIIKSLYILEK